MDNSLINKDLTLEEIVKQVAEEEGLSYEETMNLFKKGLKDVNWTSKLSQKEKDKRKAKRKLAKKSRKKNRK